MSQRQASPETSTPMWTVAVTGRSGSGKSSVSGHYARLGYPVADGDAISRHVTHRGSACLAQLVQAFGPGILNCDGTLNRRGLADVVFGNTAARETITAITHPHILAETQRLAAAAKAAGSRLFFVDGAVIVGGPFEAMCDRIVVVTANDATSLRRIMQRDGIGEQAARNRLASQLPEARLVAAADYVIENNGGLAALEEKADAVLERLLREVGHPG